MVRAPGLGSMMSQRDVQRNPGPEDSGPLANLELTVESCGLQRRFAAIAALEDISRGKPDPEVFLLAAERAGVRPEQTVVFEDAPVGILAAEAAGMRAVGVTTTHPAPALFEAGADKVVETLEKFPLEWVLRHVNSSRIA